MSPTSPNPAEDILRSIPEIVKKIKERQRSVKAESIGIVEEAGDGIAIVRGLAGAMFNEVLLFPRRTYGLVLSLEEDKIGSVILGESSHIRQGDVVRATGSLLEIPVSEEFVGRVIDPLGRPLDGKPTVKTESFFPMERIAPGVLDREPVDTPLQTGIKAIDSMIPIGRGQRELVIGDRGTGKSSTAITTVINQKDEGVICIYVTIGQKAAFVARLISIFERFGAMEHTIIVSATASDPSTLQYIAPYAGCAMGEYFAYQGRDALIVYDDLTKHAWAYRELSLLLERPSGREAYPGDIFYLHSRLLERSIRFSKTRGGGSLTALPIIETQTGDVSAYIPTNVISITDGQIYLEPDLFYAGVRPAVNVGLSVSRVGGAAQMKAMKQVAGKLRLDLAQYRELAAFAQFASDLDPQTQKRLERGARVTEILKQGWETPVPVEEQVIIIWAVTNGFLDAVRMDAIRKWEEAFLQYVQTSAPEIIHTIHESQRISPELETTLTRTAQTFNSVNSQLMTESEM